MNIFRTIAVGFASLVFMIALTGFVYIFTLQTTVMDRSVIKGWLSESKLYDGRLIDALVQTTNAGGAQNGAPQPATVDALSASPEAIKTALNATFSPQFTQTQLEGVVDNAYNWIDGSSPEFTFSIPIDQKRDTLITQLAKAIEPQILALPVCQASRVMQQSTCRPPDMTVEQLANQLTAQSIDESGAFAQPITNESFSKANQNNTQQSEQNTLSQLPAINKGADLLILTLPIATAISLGVIILATTSGHRLARVARLSRRVFFAMLFIFLPTILVVWLAKDNDFGLSSIFIAQTGQLVIPLIKTIAVGILSQLALITGIIGGISAVAWIVFSVWQRHTSQPVPAIQPLDQTSQAPIESTPSLLQQPNSAEQPPTNYQR